MRDESSLVEMETFSQMEKLIFESVPSSKKVAVMRRASEGMFADDFTIA